jgi:hypothetical protein
MDGFEGNVQYPLSLHRYLYGAGNPVDRLDPSGRDFDLGTATAVAGTITVLSNLAITGLAVTAPNGKSSGTGLPTGLLLSLRVGLGAQGLYGGGGVDFYLDRNTHQLYYAPTVEGGTSPITLFNNYKGGAYSVAFGGAWVDSPSDLQGFGFSAVWPARFFRTVLGILGGSNEAFGTLTAIANRNVHIRNSDWAATVGYSPSGASYFEIGLRSNAFSSLVSYAGKYRLFTPDLTYSLDQGAGVVQKAVDAIEGAADNLNDDTYLQVLDELTP